MSQAGKPDRRGLVRAPHLTEAFNLLPLSPQGFDPSSVERVVGPHRSGRNPLGIRSLSGNHASCSEFSRSAAVLLAPAAGRAQHDPAAQVKDVAGGKPTIEPVFVIDTTGSMGGLIEGAKQKVWSIVNDVMKSPSKTEVRMGLVAYRDHGDAYVTEVTPVTRDLDHVYNTLDGLQGRGRRRPGPEDVRQALADGRPQGRMGALLSY